MANLPFLSNPRKRKLETPQALDHYPGLTPATRRVYACLVEHCRSKARCWPSRRRIAEQAGCCLRTVDRALNQLETHGLIRRLYVIQDHKQRSSIYLLTDLSPIESILSPARPTPKNYVPGRPVEKLSTSQNVAPGSTPIPTQPQVPPHTPPARRETATRRPRIAQDGQTPRQTGKAPRIDPRPHSPAEAALWCLALDRGYSDLPGNRRRLALVVARFGLNTLRRLVSMASATRIHEPGAYLQRLIMRTLADETPRRLAATG